jgi:predicted nucleotidyltransferase
MNSSVSWVVFAGAAAYCYGSKRRITDVDILVKRVDLEKAKMALSNIVGVDIVADLRIKTEHGICYFFMDDEMMERVRWIRFLGVTVPVIPVEDNIVFKAILQRGKDKGKYDVEDIQYMITNEKVDLDYLKKRIRKYDAEKRVEPLLKFLRIL